MTTSFNQVNYHTKALIHESELDFIANCTMDYPNLETGGNLFGFWTNSGYPVIQYVLGPGQAARRTQTTFHQERDYLVNLGALLQEKHGLQHIGEWHSHHTLALNTPSFHDEHTMRKAIKEYKLKRFLLVICNREVAPTEESNSDTAENSLVTAHGYLFRSGRKRYQQCAWVVLEAKSAIRQVFDDQKLIFDDQYNELIFDDQYKKLICEPKVSGASWLVQPRTSLQEYVPEKPDISKEHWLNTESCKYVFTKVYKKLQMMAEEVRIIQNQNDSISIRAIYENNDFEILFPFEFPESKPVFYRISESGSKHVCEIEEGEGVMMQLYESMDEILNELPMASAKNDKETTTVG